MFKNIYIDRKDNSFKLWETNGDVIRRPFKCRSWVENSSLTNSPYKTIFGVPVQPVFKSIYQEREDIKDGNLRHEIDIQPEIRILSELYQDVESLDFKLSDFNICSFDIETATGRGFPEPVVAEREVNLISIYSSTYKKYMIYGTKQVDHIRLHNMIVEKNNVYNEMANIGKKYGDLRLHENYEYVACSSEGELFEKFFDYVDLIRPDIFTGWNSNRFDLPYIVNRCKKINVYNYTKLSPVGKVYLRETFNDQFKKVELAPVISGVSCIDYLELYKQLTKHLGQKESYKLDFIANEELEIGKVKLGDSGLGLCDKDWDSFVLYNMIDTNLLVLLDMKMALFESLIATCSEARIPFEYFFTSKRVILGFMMTYMHRKGLVIPHMVEQVKEAYDGAHIKMNPRVYRYGVSFDAKAWYPSIMRSCNISPETKVLSKEKPIGNFSKSVIEGVWYDNSKKGIIPEIVEVIVDGRDEFKRLQKKYSDPESNEFNKELSDKFKRKQNAYKIFANSIYGLLGNPYFQFYDVHNAASIAGIGNKGIQHVISYVNKWIDLKLPTNEEFRKEFGQYANVLITGPLDEKYINSFDADTQASLGVNKRLILAHTDSFFLNFEDLYTPFKDVIRSRVEYDRIVAKYTDKSSKDYDSALDKYFSGMAERKWEVMTFTEFMLRFNHCVFDNVMSKITKKWATDHNYKEDHLWFKLEKCSDVIVALSKAHYICYLQYDEGDLLLHLPFKKRLKAVGVELIKSDTPKWSKDKIYDILEELFTTPDKKHIARKIGMLYKDFRNPENIHLISKPISINSLGPTAANTYPAPRLGALKWNLIIEEDPELSSYSPIIEGTKVKWVYVKEPNKFNLKAISFNSEIYPPELAKYFTIDYKKQWDKVFKAPLLTIFEMYGWGNIFEGDVDSIRRMFKKR